MDSYLVDTNVLLRASDPASSQYQQADHALTKLATAGTKIFITPQNLIEFWSVVTRSRDANGFDWSVPEAVSEIEKLLSNFLLLDDTPAIFPYWRYLVRTYNITGRDVHDARLVAVMHAHDITHFLTFDTDDYRIFPGITVVHPSNFP